MSQENLSGVKTFTAGEALAAYCRVKLHTEAGQVVYADAGEECIGTTIEAVASGDPVAIRLRHAGITVKCTAAEPFAAHASLYGGDDGTVQDTESGRVPFPFPRMCGEKCKRFLIRLPAVDYNRESGTCGQ